MGNSGSAFGAPVQPRLGVQGPVVAWQDPWAGAVSDRIMRTGTGVAIDSQDPAPTPAGFLGLLKSLGADFYVHHVMPDLTGQDDMLRDTAGAGLDVVLGNEYGNINGPYADGTNRYDVPPSAIAAAAASGHLIGLLYDEPEHLQINADQYRKDSYFPQFATTAGADAVQAEQDVEHAARDIVDQVQGALEGTRSKSAAVLSEQVFPVLFHTLARAGMTPCPKVMKESFQPLQLATALGASLQYGRDFWVCADLWGPDVGPWFTRAPGFPGHSPREYASALRMAYYFAPSHLFAEAVDVLAVHSGDDQFALTEFGEVWREFATGFVPSHPVRWSFAEATPTIVLIHAEDSDFGRGTRPFGDRSAHAPLTSRSIFEAWHLLSRGAIPAYGSCMHIDGYDFPRHTLNDTPRSCFPLASATPVESTMHPLFQPVNNVLVYDERVTDDRLGHPDLIIAVGSRLPERTRQLLRSRASEGATVIVAEWLTTPDNRVTQKVGIGRWIVTSDLLHDPEVHLALAPHLGPDDRWSQRFGDVELRMYATDEPGVVLEFEIAHTSERGSQRRRVGQTRSA